MTESQTKENYFLSQPHQPFFILGITNAIIMMIIFALSYKNVLTLHTTSLGFHAYSLIFTVFLNVFTGFLFTTFPRFCQTAVIKKEYYTKIFFANLLGTLLFLYGVVTQLLFMQLGMGILLLSHLFIIYKLHTIYKTGQAVDKQDAFWILLSSYIGLIGHLLFILSTVNIIFENLAIQVSFYLYLIFLTFSVAQRMIPFFSHSYEIKTPKLTLIVFLAFFSKILFYLLNIQIASILIDFLLGVFLLREFISWKFTPLTSPAILWVLHLGLFWLPTALLLSALFGAVELYLGTSFYYIGMHLIALGFLTTILIGFGTRVTLGHSAQAPHADKFVTGLFFFIQVVVILRALFSVNIALGWELNFLFDISLTAWIILFLLWGGRYGKVLFTGAKL